MNRQNLSHRPKCFNKCWMKTERLLTTYGLIQQHCTFLVSSPKKRCTVGDSLPHKNAIVSITQRLVPYKRPIHLIVYIF